MTATPELSFVLPAHNEAGCVVPAVRSLASEARQLGYRYEVIVVDDGSTDGTGERLVELGGALSELRVVRHPHNRGYGAALRSGFAATRGDVVVFTDADLQFDARDLGRLLAAHGPRTVACGRRSPRADPLVRRVYGSLWSGLVRIVLGVPVRDVNCAFKALPGEWLRSLSLGSEGAFVNAELLALAKQAGLEFHQVDVRHLARPSGQASGADPQVIVRAFAELFRLGWSLGPGGQKAPVFQEGLDVQGDDVGELEQGVVGGPRQNDQVAVG